MRAVIQRVSSASVSIEGEVVGSIEKGLMVLIGIKADDTEKDMEYIITKISGLRVFEDEAGKMNLSVKDIGGKLLIVPNFTLYGSAVKGMRPSFIASGSVDEAKNKYEVFMSKLNMGEIPVESGVFQADMQVGIVNDGPVTIMLDSSKLF